jgi:two-component system cell cycle response regulator
LIGVRVLLAHRSEASRRRFERVLRARGDEVDVAPGAAEALARCRELRPDVLVVARALCEQDGSGLIEQVKADARIFRTAIVVIAPDDLSVEDAAADLARGAQDFLLEPVRDAELFARVQAAGRIKAVQEEHAAHALQAESRLFEDPLTRLNNRRFLLAQLDAMASGARRHRRPLAAVMLDLDRFEPPGDAPGGDADDGVLLAAADALRHALRAEDVVGRLGGAEFLALLPDTGQEAAPRASERMRAAVAHAGGPMPVTASVGWAVLQGTEAPSGLVKRADDALHAAKVAGRDRVVGPATLPRRR